MNQNKDAAHARINIIEKELAELKKVLDEPVDTYTDVLNAVLGKEGVSTTNLGPRMYYNSGDLHNPIQAAIPCNIVSTRMPETSDKFLKNYSPLKSRLEGLILLNKLANIAAYVNKGLIYEKVSHNPSMDKCYSIRIRRKAGSELEIIGDSYSLNASITFKNIPAAKKAIEIMGEAEVIQALKTFE